MIESLDMQRLTTDISLAIYADVLHANSTVYEWLVQQAQQTQRQEDAEEMLNRLTAAARFAAKFHPGRFVDGAIENLAWRIGSELTESVDQCSSFSWLPNRKDMRRHILHVASEVLDVGGHTRMLYHWVGHDRDSRHSLVILNQNDDIPLPQWLCKRIQRNRGELLVFPNKASACQKASWLRTLSRKSADLVILHQHTDDVVPTIAFATMDCPPVLFVNHADHVFWLGSSVSDLVINLRTAASNHSIERRFISNNTMVPIPILDELGRISRADARRKLGISDHQVMLLSIGRAEKYRSCGPFSFVATAGKILNSQTHAHLYIVGETATGIAPYVRGPIHERLHFVGQKLDPFLYRAAADIYLESFPFGSNTALLEAALMGIPVVPAYAPLFPLLVAGTDAVQDLLSNPINEQAYIEQVESLTQSQEQRVDFGQKLRTCLISNHVGKGWLNHLIALYQKTDSLTHSPRLIPIVPFSSTDADVSLSLWSFMADGKTNFATATLGDITPAILRHHAYVAKYVGNYGAAQRLAWRALQCDPYARTSLRLLAVTLLGWGIRFIRRLVHRNN